jgi:mannose/fructose/N-acetylgalactosamine-specific phosphotransferase system component IIC
MAAVLKMLLLERSYEWTAFGFAVVCADLISIMGIAICFALKYSDD